MDGGRNVCTYPADQVFRLNGSIEFPNKVGDAPAPADQDGSEDGSRPTSSHGSGGLLSDPGHGLGAPLMLKPWSKEVAVSPRDVLVASTGYRLLSVDYAQLEVRILAHYSEDPGLLEAFAEPPGGLAEDVDPDCAEDFFRRLSRLWRGRPQGSPVSSDERSAAKEMCYGII